MQEAILRTNEAETAFRCAYSRETVRVSVQRLWETIWLQCQLEDALESAQLLATVRLCGEWMPKALHQRCVEEHSCFDAPE